VVAMHNAIEDVGHGGAASCIGPAKRRHIVFGMRIEEFRGCVQIDNDSTTPCRNGGDGCIEGLSRSNVPCTSRWIGQAARWEHSQIGDVGNKHTRMNTLQRSQDLVKRS
jgi:hypothetical protein